MYITSQTMKAARLKMNIERNRHKEDDFRFRTLDNNQGDDVSSYLANFIESNSSFRKFDGLLICSA